jgi:hypothetical protein
MMAGCFAIADVLLRANWLIRSLDLSRHHIGEAASGGCNSSPLLPVRQLFSSSCFRTVEAVVIAPTELALALLWIVQARLAVWRLRACWLLNSVSTLSPPARWIPLALGSFHHPTQTLTSPTLNRPVAVLILLALTLVSCFSFDPRQLRELTVSYNALGDGFAEAVAGCLVCSLRCELVGCSVSVRLLVVASPADADFKPGCLTNVSQRP